SACNSRVSTRTPATRARWAPSRPHSRYRFAEITSHLPGRPRGALSFWRVEWHSHDMADEFSPSTSVAAGQIAIPRAHALYTPAMLAIYDLLVHGVSNHVAWRCPTR